MEKKITIHEKFFSFQGEGAHSGRSAYFIRTYGCPLHCTFCDSAGTWHPDHKPEGMEKLSADFLSRAAIDSGAAICVLTGGEPAVHDWTEFLGLHKRQHVKQPVHIETSGAFPLKGEFDWVTLSPKKTHLPLPENYEKADELKLIIESPEDIDFWLSYIEHYLFGRSLDRRYWAPEWGVSVWLHPEWSQSRNPLVLNAITEAVKAYPLLFRAGWQLHKVFNSDFQDSGTRPNVPLGGVEESEPFFGKHIGEAIDAFRPLFSGKK